MMRLKKMIEENNYILLGNIPFFPVLGIVCPTR